MTLLKAAADNVLRTSMELGGNAPAIVFEDADLNLAVEGVLAAKMRNGGEACTSANRILVHESVAEEFTEKFAAKVGALAIGNGLEDGVDVGPMVEAKAVENLDSLVQDAVDKGGRAIVGGTPVRGEGHFFTPTVIVDAPTTARVFREEIFGPIAPIFTFSDEAEAIAMGNDTEFGLASYVFSQDPARLYRLADGLEFGLMGFNAGVISNAAAPFGGVKQSGLGREGGAEGIAEYSSVQYIGQRDPYAG